MTGTGWDQQIPCIPTTRPERTPHPRPEWDPMVTPGHPGQRRGNPQDPMASAAGGNRSPAHSMSIPLAGVPPNTTRGGPMVVPTGMHPHPTGGNLLAGLTPTGLTQPLRGVPQPPAVVGTPHTPHTTLQPGKLTQPHQSGPPTVRSITPPRVGSTAGPVAPSHLLGKRSSIFFHHQSLVFMH